MGFITNILNKIRIDNFKGGAFLGLFIAISNLMYSKLNGLNYGIYWFLLDIMVYLFLGIFLLWEISEIKEKKANFLYHLPNYLKISLFLILIILILEFEIYYLIGGIK